MQLQETDAPRPRWAFWTGLMALGVFVRSCVGLGPYSGANTPPKFGDFECQRHWMEITYHLPIYDWYFPTPDNDLSWWGLDYPPLTAYWSLGAQLVNPSYVALHTSRGLEKPGLKLFMRSTVLAADLLVLFPAALLFVSSFYRTQQWSAKTYALAAVVLQPAMIIIDHGHFQYNSVSLGLTLAAAALICSDNPTLGRHVGASMLFTLALNYKQMSLYYALPFFAVLLGRIVQQRTWRECLLHLTAVGGTVISVCLVLWSPWLSKEGLLQMAHRIFPVARGLYEDKVGNLWCSISPMIKLKDLYSTQFLTRLCMTSTLVACLPKMLYCMRNPSPRVFAMTLFNNALAFYLFSYHVHEKSILLPALPASALAADYPLPVFIFNFFAAFSMFPLLKREGLVVQYIALMALYVLSAAPMVVPALRTSRTQTIALIVSLTGAGVLHACDALITPPARLPDLWTLLITSYSCAHFFVFYFVSAMPHIHDAQPQKEKES